MNNLKRHTLSLMNMIDIIALVLTFVLAFFVRFHIMQDIFPTVWLQHYLPVLVLFLLAYAIVNVFYLYKHADFLKRNHLHEFIESAKLSLFVVGITVIFLNFMKESANYSRIFEAIFLALFFVIVFLLRSFSKYYLRQDVHLRDFVEKVVIVAKEKEAEDLIAQIKQANDWRYHIVGVLLQDESQATNIRGEKVLGYFRDGEALHNCEYDAVLLAGQKHQDENRKLIQHFRALGKIVYFHIAEFSYTEEYRSLEAIGDCAVVSYRMIAPMSRRQLLFKRISDVTLSLLLLPLYLILALWVRITYYCKDPGPVLIHRPRVGRNNILFERYHFRVYRLDAEQRLHEGKNPYTCIGRFLEWSHFDGAPGLLNVLSGHLSFVGPKAPNLVKYLAMSEREKNILQAKPGIMGVWSILPDSDMKRIERAEQEYIENWSLLKDIAILGVSWLRYLSFHSFRINGETHRQEEIDQVSAVLERQKDFVYLENYHEKETETYVVYLWLKRIFDILVATLALSVMAIPMFILAIFVYAEDGGNPFYGHERIGKKGKRIKIYKFRSMRMDAANVEELLTKEQLRQYRREFKITDDPRITKIGSVLRKTSLDELPQLFNILRGDLSVVGPRPIVEEETKRYGKNIAKFLSVQPGLTGYWQAYARNTVGYENGQRQRMELYYVDHQSWHLDLRIIIQTFISVLQQKGAE